MVKIESFVLRRLLNHGKKLLMQQKNTMIQKMIVVSHLLLVMNGPEQGIQVAIFIEMSFLKIIAYLANQLVFMKQPQEKIYGIN